MHDVPFFDRVAPLYDLAMPPADPAVLAAGLARARRPVEWILDVGGGSGRAAVAVEGDPVVVDASAGMLARARRKGLDCVRADAATLPVCGGAVDAVLIVDALHHFPDPGRAVAAAADALAPGGVLLVREFDPTTLRGRALVLAERAVGFDATFRAPADLRALLANEGLDAAVVETGFGYTVAGVRPDGEPGGQ